MAVHLTFAGDFTNCHLLTLLYGINNCFESFWLMDGKLSEDLAVYLNIMLLQAIDKLRVGNTNLSGSVIDAGNPDCAKVTLFVAAIAVAVA